MNNSTSSHSTSNDVQPARGSEGKFDRLKTLLREMFQLDRGDLDFGLYRIMNLKTAEIETFLDNDLLPQVQEQLDLTDNQERVRLEKELQDAREQAQMGGYDPDTHPSPKIIELNQRLAEMQKDADSEADVYNHLANFFARYYAEGDFISQRRYSSGGRAAYLIPYDGEEVKLHWANADQYYVKTTENYASYVFTIGTGETERRVRFEIAAADNERDNIKEADSKQRRFVLADDAIAVEDGVLIVRFEHRPLTDSEKKTWTGNGVRQQGRINETVVDQILNSVASDWRDLLAVLAPTDANEKRTLLEKHVERYTAKNSFDYFIHKDLGGFLHRELDLYLNTEVLNLDDLEQGDALRLDRALARVRATRHIGGKIIDFLAQLEDFQKQLWLKKKFVLETNWCVTLDRVPEALYPEIADNAAQCEEWVKLFAVDEISLNGGTTWSNPPSIDFLGDNPYLVLDTRHFNRDFTDRLLTALSEAGSLDEQLDGLLVHGENFQALNLMQTQYQGQVECIHIDPPYNTQTSGFIYKNGYQHSSWLAMMQNRILVGNSLLNSNGVILCHIDENEYENLHLLFQHIGIPGIGTIVWDKRNPMTGGGGIAIQHEYIICRSRSDNAIRLRAINTQAILDKAKELVAKYGGVSNSTRCAFSSWVSKNAQFTGGEKAYHFIDDTGQVYSSVSLRAPERRTDPKFFEPLLHPLTGRPCAVPPNGFSRTPDTLKAMVERGEILFGVDETTQPRQKRLLEKGTSRQLSSVIQDAKRGKTDLDALGLENFPYCHSVSFYEELLGATAKEVSDIVLDFFAGSGTTGHAIINLNREDDGQRKYILVEIGDYFDTVLLPRMKKVVYSRDWKDGKPVSRKGITQLFKYIRLESYEDTMDSLEVTPPSDAQQDLLAENPALAEDYRLRYALGEETVGSACLLGKAFADPFSYTLSVVRDGVRREVQVDLPETFNYLIGLRVASSQRIDGVLAITGMDPEGHNCLILWRNLDETDHAALDAWFDRNREQFSGSLDIIYANGDHTLNAMQQPGENWTAKTIEPIFRELMFGGPDEKQSKRLH